MATEQQSRKLAAIIVEHSEVLNLLPKADAQWAIMNGQKAIARIHNCLVGAAKEDADLRARAAERLKRSTDYTQCVSTDEDILLNGTPGTMFLSDYAELFSGGLDPNFTNYLKNIIETPTSAIKVEVHEIINSGSISVILSGLNMNLSKLRLSQGQIIQFVMKHSKWLHPQGGSTFFPFKVGVDSFIADINRNGGELRAKLCHFSDHNIYDARDRIRIVVPERTLAS